MASVVEIKKILERKAGEFEANKETITDRIKEGIKTAREKLNRVEKELLRGLEISFGPNVYAEQLAEINSGKPFSPDSAAAVAKTPVPVEYGPSEEAFGRLYVEISLLTDERSTQSAQVVPSAPKNLKVSGLSKNGFYDTVGLSWSAVAAGSDNIRYQVQMAHGCETVCAYDGGNTSCLFSNLMLGTKYIFCVRCVCVSSLGQEKVGPWCDPVEFTTSPIPVAQNV